MELDKMSDIDSYAGYYEVEDFEFGGMN